MIPLRDINPTRTRPVFTWGLIGLNAAVWLYELSLGPELQTLVDRFGAVPYYLLEDPTLSSMITPLTSMFMHAGWVHLIWNMWFLHVFGDNIEDELGRGRYLGFYLICGLAAVITQVAIDPTSTTPMIGASGAIAGILGGYMMLHPRAPIITFAFIVLVQLPAWIFLFVWFGLQLLQGFGALPGDTGGVAFFAHVGGFLTGVLLVRALKPTELPTQKELAG